MRSATSSTVVPAGTLELPAIRQAHLDLAHEWESDMRRLFERSVVAEAFEDGRHGRDRTADPYRVKVVLYPLSYVPEDR